MRALSTRRRPWFTGISRNISRGPSDLASQLRQSGSQRYVWTTGSWLLYEYLEQATAEERDANGKGHLCRRHRMARPSIHLADRVDGSVDDLRRHWPVPRRWTGVLANYDGGQDDRRARPYPRVDCSAGRAGCEVSGYRRKRCEYPCGSPPPCFSGRIRAERRSWSCITTATAAWCECRVPIWRIASGCAGRQQRPAHPGRDSSRPIPTLGAVSPTPRLFLRT